MARGRVWMGIRDWFRPVEWGGAGVSRRTPPNNPNSDLVDDGLLNSDVASLTWSTNSGRQKDRRAFERGFGLELVHGGSGGGAALDGSYATPVEDTSDASSIEVAFGEADEAELADFLAADLDPVSADPAFRQRLREELWEIVVAQGDAQRENS